MDTGVLVFFPGVLTEDPVIRVVYFGKRPSLDTAVALVSGVDAWKWLGRAPLEVSAAAPGETKDQVRVRMRGFYKSLGDDEGEER